VGDDQVGVLAVEADRAAAVLVDESHQLGIDAAHQHHLHQLHRLAVGHAKAVDEARGLAEAPHEGVDLRAAAVDDDGMDSRGAKAHHVEGEGFSEPVTAHRGAAALDHHRLTAPPGERLGGVESAGTRRAGGNEGSLVRDVFRCRG
jgi:hypothetical protein